MKVRDQRHINLYTDKKGRVLLYNARKKEGYIIPEADVSKLAALQYRYYMILAIAILLFFLFNIPWYLTLGFTLILTGMIEYVYRVMMLNNYTKVTNYTPANVLDKSIATYKKSSAALINRSLAYGVIGILLIYSIKDQAINLPETQVLLVVAAFALINSLYHIVHLIKRKKG